MDIILFFVLSILIPDFPCLNIFLEVMQMYFGYPRINFEVVLMIGKSLHLLLLFVKLRKEDNMH